MEQLGNITLHHGDCLEVLRELPDKSFQLAIVDPPYYSGPERRGFFGSERSTSGVKRVDYPKSAKWLVPGEEYFKELERVCQYYIVWGCNYFDWIFAPGRIVWDKCNQSSTFSDCEIAATNLFSSVRLFAYMWNGIMQGNKKLNEKRIHPTQKPVAIYAWLLTQYAQEGWRILDTHLGSGSHAIACDQLGFPLLGIELDQQYYEAARKRITDYQNKPRLF